LSIICGGGGSRRQPSKDDQKRLFILGFLHMCPLIYAFSLIWAVPYPEADALIFAAGVAGSIFVAGKLRHHAPLTPLDAVCGEREKK